MISRNASCFISAAALLAATTAHAQSDGENGTDLARLEEARQDWNNHQDDAAVHIWQTLALRNNAKAWYNLGQAYRLGRGTTTNQDAALAAYRLAVRFGYAKAREQLGLTLCKLPAHKDEGLRMLIEVADEEGGARAAYVVGLAEMKGDGLPQNNIRAIAHLTSAATSGVDEAWAPLTILRATELEKQASEMPSAPKHDLGNLPHTVPQKLTPMRAIEIQPVADNTSVNFNKLNTNSTSTITFTGTYPMTLGQIAAELERTSGSRVIFALSEADDFKRNDTTHRLRVSWTGPADAFANNIARLFNLVAQIEPGQITFISAAQNSPRIFPSPNSGNEQDHALSPTGSSSDRANDSIGNANNQPTSSLNSHRRHRRHRRHHRRYGG